MTTPGHQKPTSRFETALLVAIRLVVLLVGAGAVGGAIYLILKNI